MDRLTQSVGMIYMDSLKLKQSLDRIGNGIVKECRFFAASATYVKVDRDIYF